METIIRWVAKYLKTIVDHIAKESLKRSVTILDEIKKGGYL